MLSFCTSVFDANINYWAVLVCTVLSMVIGTVWYGPLFGKKFMAAMGMDKWTPEQQAAMKKQMGMSYALQFLASLVMFFILSIFTAGTSPHSGLNGIHVALLTWVGFVVPMKIGDTIWGGKWSLFWIGVGYMLVLLVASGAIIGAWR